MDNRMHVEVCLDAVDAVDAQKRVPTRADFHLTITLGK